MPGPGARAAAPGRVRVPYRLRRLGVLASPVPGDEREAWGLCNPACARDAAGDLWLFPRLIAAGNYSRIGRARVVVDAHGSPAGLGPREVVLEPVEAWERNAQTGGGCEDPRITDVPALGLYVMTYVAYGPFGPRVALATSHDLERWERLGPVEFAYQPGLGTDLGMYPNKDAVLLPEAVTDPSGRRAYALLHRPVWDLGTIIERERSYPPVGTPDPRPAIWVSFADAEQVERDPAALQRFTSHHPLAGPRHDWEALKIGCGPPPVRVPEGWLLLYHGVAGSIEPAEEPPRHVRYATGAMLFDPRDVTRVTARTRRPLLTPDVVEERRGLMPDVVFPTAIDSGPAGTWVFYGMADTRIGYAALERSGDDGAVGGGAR